ncbi:hypothetical protein [Sphingomonas sp.]|uniref:hypothetical protein n=1 Tax=Sphingomonas sp. TaxID=28214 RepID=UPI0035BC0875
MIVALLLQAAAVLPSPGVLPQQDLPSKGCAAYLWSVADRSLVAMASADAATLRVSIDGAVVDIARARESGVGDYGFAGVTDYAGRGLTATLDMTIARKTDLAGGAAVPAGTLTLARTGQDSVVVPVAGLIGCA